MGYHQYNLFIIYNSNEKKLCFNDPWYLKWWCLTAAISTTAGYTVWSKKAISFPKVLWKPILKFWSKQKKPHWNTAVIAFWAYSTHVHNITSNLSSLEKWYSYNPNIGGLFLISWAGRDTQDIQKFTCPHC